MGQDDRGRLWAGSREGMFYFDHDRFVLVPGVPGGNILSMAGDGHGKVWISNLDHGLFLSTPEGAVERIPWAQFGPQRAAVALLPDRSQGGLWLGFYDGGIAYFKDARSALPTMPRMGWEMAMSVTFYLVRMALCGPRLRAV